ncbi:MAG TPA: DJ-1/PfpI family protein [Opitutaceae bacterium]|mgnify:FL=1|nr:DJ-1/PfpI family protein [Opitutaceae bacterium]
MSSAPSVLVVLMNGFEEIEAVAPIDLLRRAGARVVLASLGPESTVIGRCNLALLAETTLAVAAQQPYDLIFLPGGPGVKHLRADARVVPLVQAQVAAGRLVAAICAAPLVLHDAGLLAGRRYTAFPATEDELPHILHDQRVVEDGPLLTSRGAGTALDLGYAMVARLFTPAKAEELRRQICA